METRRRSKRGFGISGGWSGPPRFRNRRAAPSRLVRIAAGRSFRQFWMDACITRAPVQGTGSSTRSAPSNAATALTTSGSSPAPDVELGTRNMLPGDSSLRNAPSSRFTGESSMATRWRGPTRLRCGRSSSPTCSDPASPPGSLDRNVSGTCSRMSFHARISGAWPARANLSDQLAGELSQNSTILPSEQSACSPRRRESRVTSGRLGVAIQSSNTSSQRRNTAGSTRRRLDDFAHRQPNTLSGSRNSSRAAEAIRSSSLSSIPPLIAPDGAPSANRGVRSRGRS